MLGVQNLEIFKSCKIRRRGQSGIDARTRLQYAETDKSKGRLESATEMFRMEATGEVSNLAAAKAANAESRLMAVQPVSSVRLDFEEVEFRPVAVVGAYSKLTTKAIKLAQVVEKVGTNDPSNIFKTFRPQGTSDWMAVPTGGVGELEGTDRHIRWEHRERVAKHRWFK